MVKLVFRDRVAEDGDRFYFDCYRAAEHPPETPRIRVSFASRSDRDRYVTRHDALHHDELLARQLGVPKASPALGDVISAFLQQLDLRWRRKEADIRTVDYYRQACRRLLGHFGPHIAVNAIDSPAIIAYVDARRLASASEGALIQKDVKALGTVFRDRGFVPQWVLRRGAIRVKHRDPEETAIDPEELVWFVRAMPPDSLERDFTVFKLATMIRNEEMYAADVGDVDLQVRELEYFLRNKQGEMERHVSYLSDPALEIARRRCAGRPRKAPLFELQGRRLAQSSLRKRFIAASARATKARRKENPDAQEIRITAVGKLRELGSTTAQDKLGGAHQVAGHLKHRSESTTRKHYYRPRHSQVIANSKDVTGALAELLARL